MFQNLGEWWIYGISRYYAKCKMTDSSFPKNHYDSDLFLVDDVEFYKRLMSATKEVVDMLKKSLKVERVGMIMEWMWVNHLHLKLYPMHGLNEEREPNESPRHVFFETYPGYLTTQMWNQADMEKLGAIQDRKSVV